MRICERCVLPETYPGVQFDGEGVCNCCRRAPARIEDRAAKRAHVRQKFESLAERIRGTSGYHCLLAYSGGKDSTYTMGLLRQHYGLRVLAVTLDNGFVSPAAFTNIRRVVEQVDADHLLVKPSFGLLRKLFVHAATNNPFPIKALERASSMCNVCMGMVKAVTLRIAIEQRVPIVAYGWSPGQAPASASFFRLNASMIRQMAGARMAPLIAAAGDALAPYLLTDAHLASDLLPYSANPLAFHDYSEHQFMDEIQQMGWQPPTDTDGNSTNCLLNSLAIRLHMKDYGFHPYASEIADLVRGGMMTREEGIAKLGDLGSSEVAAQAARRLGLKFAEEQSSG